MGLFDGVLGGLVGAGASAMIKDVIEKNGGLQGLVSQFEKTGLGATVQSWIGTGANQVISGTQIQQVLGSDFVQNLAGKLGIPPDELAGKIAEVLPDTVDKMTPDGKIPDAA